MRKRLLILMMLCIGGLYGCGGVAPISPLATPAEKGSAGLFLDAEYSGEKAAGSEVVRSRFVKINAGYLLDEVGQARVVEEITLNLFSDVTYVGVIEQVEQSGDGYTWTGSLKGVENSTVFIVYTSGVFIVHAASPGGVYEVSNVGEEIYQVIEIDQTKLPGGGQD